MTNTIIVSGDNVRIGLDVHGYEHDLTEDPDDANWLSCAVEVNAQKLTARSEGSLRTREIHQFAEELEQLAAGTSTQARLQSIEGWLSIVLVQQPSGTTEVSGSIVGGDSTSLNFRFSMDREQEQVMRSSLLTVCQEFPQR